jgi:hypothetical protein
MSRKQRSTTFSPGVRSRMGGAYKRSAAFGVVYFITCDHPDFPIKIGFATDLIPRIAAVQTSLPYQVKILHTTPGNRLMERDIGRQFEKHRIRGEWFSREPVLAYLAETVPFAEVTLK